MQATLRVALAILVVVAVSRESAAQTTAQLPIQFDFLNPGARSLAMGGAFSALADDATAGFTNPAGLMLLVSPEISVEGRFRRLDTRFLERGRLSGTVLNRGEDTIDAAAYATNRDDDHGISFISFSYPRPRWAASIYRHVLASVDNDFLYRGVFTGIASRDLALTGGRGIRLRTYGASFAYRLSPDLTVGVGGSIQNFKLAAGFARLGFTSFPNDVFGAPDQTQIGSTVHQTADALGIGMNFGMHWQMTEALRLGATYRRNGTFDFEQTDWIASRQETVIRDGKFRAPDTFGVGLAWRPKDVLMIAADYVRVGYASLKTDFVDYQAISTGRESQLALDNGNELHFGVEYVLTEVPGKLAIRAGTWLDPAHAVRYVSDGSGDVFDLRLNAILPGVENTWHGTFGVGVTASRMLELNGAVDVASRSMNASFSAIIRLR